MKGPLTEAQKKDIIDTINFMFEGPRMIKVVKEDDNYVYLLDESGEVTEWDRDQALGE
ncbi:MAG: hypothetical protein PUE02_08850 [Eggerthellaceae bacterium]|nr:hypothetical protein [Eggerthellaceae bacterium]